MHAIRAPVLRFAALADGPGVNQDESILRSQALDDAVPPGEVAPDAGLQRTGEPRVIPAGATYKIRGQAAERPFLFREARAFPSYLQAGPSFFIEKSKRRMIAEDIAAALRLARGGQALTVSDPPKPPALIGRSTLSGATGAILALADTTAIILLFGLLVPR